MDDGVMMSGQSHTEGMDDTKLFPRTREITIKKNGQLSFFSQTKQNETKKEAVDF